MNPFTIKVTKHLATRDPELHYFKVELTGTTNEIREGQAVGTIWKESFGSEEQLRAFLRGIEAAASMLGHFLLASYDIPTNITEDQDRV